MNLYEGALIPRKLPYPKKFLVTHLVPFGLNVEDIFSPILCRSINVTGVFTFLVFFSVLVRPGTDLAQDIVYGIVYFLVTNSLYY